jgi:hypothetical protein
MSKSVAVVISAFLLACLSTMARAECPPEKFLLMEDQSFWQDDRLRLAFVMTMNKEQFEQAKGRFKGGVAFPIEGVPIEGYSDFEAAKAAGRREAQARGFTLDTSQSSVLLTHRVSQTGLAGYLACLDAERVALQLRVGQVNGSLVTVLVKFKTDDRNWRVARPTLDNFSLVSTLPTELRPNRDYSFTFKRGSDKEGLIELKVGEQSNQLTFPPVPKLTPVEYRGYVTDAVAATGSGGNNAAIRAFDSKCESPPSGWKFVPASAVVQTFETTDYTGSSITAAREEQICWQVFADTPCKECPKIIKGRVAAIITRPVPPAPTAAVPTTAPPTAAPVSGRGKKG